MSCDLRKEHFRLGSDEGKLITTNQQLHSLVGKPESKQELEQERVNNMKIKKEMRLHHFSYGKAVPQYSSMAKQAYPRHVLGLDFAKEK